MCIPYALDSLLVRLEIDSPADAWLFNGLRPPIREEGLGGCRLILSLSSPRCSRNFLNHNSLMKAAEVCMFQHDKAMI